MGIAFDNSFTLMYILGKEKWTNLINLIQIQILKSFQF
jgi:hypothetical protein